MSFAPGGQASAAGSSYAPVTYQRLMRLAARAFYNGPCPPPGRDTDPFSARSKIAKMDTRGLGVVLIDYLTTVEWTSFELLTEALRLHPVVLSRAMRFLEAGHMVRRYERRESRRKKRNIVGEALEADVAQGGDSDDDDDDGEEGGAKKKGLLTEYFTLDYARAFDALQARIHTMRASLKEQLEATNAIQAYRCPGAFCGKTYTSLDAANLVDPMDLTFKCEMCGSELVEQRATNDAEGGGGAPQHATARESKEAARRLLQAIDRELAPLTRLMTDLQHRAVPLPDAGELYEWAQRVRQREADINAAAGGGRGGAGGGSAAGGRAGGAGGAGGAGAGGGAAGGAPAAALLAGSGVTVLSAADNTNTWESQDFKVSLDGGAAGGTSLLFGGGAAAAAPAAAAAGAPGGGGGGGKKVLPWFMKAADDKATLSATAAGDDTAAAGGAAAAAGGGGGGGDGKQQQQAEYFRDFMAYMSRLQQEKREPKDEGAAGVLPLGPVAAVATAPPPFVKPEPGLAAAAPGPVSAAAAVKREPPPPLAAAVKQEAGVYSGSSAAAAAATDIQWESVGGLPPPVPQQQPMVADPLAVNAGFGGFGGGGAGGGDAPPMDADGDVEWEDV
ncbi:hypothetical protein PLESTB_001672000 [Pleodorina starrii]|uniref:Transcription initiation factor IIE subunit alpha N-terminal domain-containing protein n=1 Tax=Pleodorina starrii TaxID=330485 RepID=A0A9W6F9M5_9CHLO|nr:hypothetical protein PLESTB_001672000 [Pleodorina starrii]